MKTHFSTAILEQFSTFFRSSVLTFNRIINAIVLLLFGLLRCIERVHPPKLVDASSKLEYTGEFPLTWYVGTVRGSRVPLLNLIMGLSYGPSTISMNTSFLSMVQNRRSMLSSLNEKMASLSFYARATVFNCRNCGSSRPLALVQVNYGARSAAKNFALRMRKGRKRAQSKKAAQRGL